MLKTLAPVVAGSFLTLAGSVISLSFNSDAQQQGQLRAAYATFLSAADEASETTNSYYRDELSIFARYLTRRRFVAAALRPTDSLTLADDRRRCQEQVTRLRKASFDLLLLEPVADRRTRIRDYVRNFLESKQGVDRAAASIRHFVETGSYVRDPEAKPVGGSVGNDGDLVGVFYQQISAARSRLENQYTQLVNDVLEDDRWH